LFVPCLSCLFVAINMFFFFFFFFSSRRRHTRWPRDWSSDVCSSDLPFFTTPRPGKEGGFYELVGSSPLANDYEFEFARELINGRSEERRVGKECRCRWST